MTAREFPSSFATGSARILSSRKPAPPTIAISIRQPYAELILRGEKIIEYRSRPLRTARRAFIYASLSTENLNECEYHALDPDDLPRGVIVGIATFSPSDPDAPEWEDQHEWPISEVVRLNEPVKPVGRPQPIWFTPFPNSTKGNA